ncbi:MAG: tetratricopeptide repeat protein [Bacteroidota bacterium]|nr:tetratricopeptide repeat protein [Bacteroidota bacterium]
MYSMSFRTTKKLLYLLFFFLSLNPAFGQNSHKVDSVLSIIGKPGDSLYVQYTMALAHIYIDENNISKGFNYMDSALSGAKKIKSLKLEAFVYNNKGNFYNYLNDINKALENFDKAYKIYVSLNYVAGLRSVSLNQGNTYFVNGDLVKAESSYNNALNMHRKMSKDPNILADLYNNLGSVCGAQEKYAEAGSFFNNALDIYKQLKDSSGMAYSYNNLGILQQAQLNHIAALPLFEKALAIKLRFGTTANKAEGYRALAVAYSNLKKYDLVLENLSKSLSYTDTSAYNDHLLNLYGLMAITYERTNDLSKSVLYYKKLQEINLEVQKKEVKSQIEQKDLMINFSRLHLSDSLSQVSRIQQQESAIKRSDTIRYSLLLVVGLVIIFLLIIFQRFKVAQKQKKEISLQKNLVDEKQKEILDSINYAKKIQQTLLNEDHLSEYFPEHFILFRPKDIVSGDFYWSAKISGKEDLFFLAVCDSTGHGVPGAFMSLLNMNFLNEAINEKHIYEPHLVLEYTRKRLVESISKENQKDGFDGILLCINKTTGEITYAAANNYPVLISKNELVNLPFDRMPVGKGLKQEKFRLYTIDLKKGDLIYLTTDGFADQFGGEKGKKYLSKSMKQFFFSIRELPMHSQREELVREFVSWQGKNEQVDDVTIISIKI